MNTPDSPSHFATAMNMLKLIENDGFPSPYLEASYNDLVRAIKRDAATQPPAASQPSAQPPAGEVAKDAARYKFLRDQADPDEGQPHVTTHEQDGWGNWHKSWTTGETLDAAVDAAMSARPVLPTKEEK